MAGIIDFEQRDGVLSIWRKRNDISERCDQCLWEEKGMWDLWDFVEGRWKFQQIK